MYEFLIIICCLCLHIFELEEKWEKSMRQVNKLMEEEDKKEI